MSHLTVNTLTTIFLLADLRAKVSHWHLFCLFSILEIQIAAETLRFLLSPLLQEHEVDRIRELVAVESQGQDELQQLLDLAHQVAYRDQGMACC